MLQWWLNYCFNCDTRPYAERLAAVACLTTRWRRRGGRGQHWDFIFPAYFLEEIGEF